MENCFFKPDDYDVVEWDTVIAQAQDAKTAAAKDAEYQQKIRELFQEIEELRNAYDTDMGGGFFWRGFEKARKHILKLKQKYTEGRE